MPIDNNPLRQYFRRPSIYIRLPSDGVGYKQGVVDIPESGELPIFPMTAIDEITSKTPDALYSGQAVVDVIKSCAPAIKDPWALNAVDLDAILIAIRTATDGNNQEISSTCPKCDETNNYEINLIASLKDMDPKKYNEVLKIGELTVKFTPLTYKNLNDINKQQFEVEKLFQQIDALENIEDKTKKTQELVLVVTKSAMGALAQCIEYIESPNGTVDNKKFIAEFIENCDKQMFEDLKAFNLKLKQSTELKPMKMTCPACQHSYEQPITLNMSDFFG